MGTDETESHRMNGTERHSTDGADRHSIRETERLWTKQNGRDIADGMRWADNVITDEADSSPVSAQIRIDVVPRRTVRQRPAIGGR